MRYLIFCHSVSLFGLPKMAEPMFLYIAKMRFYDRREVQAWKPYAAGITAARAAMTVIKWSPSLLKSAEIVVITAI